MIQNRLSSLDRASYAKRDTWTLIVDFDNECLQSQTSAKSEISFRTICSRSAGWVRCSLGHEMELGYVILLTLIAVILAIEATLWTRYFYLTLQPLSDSGDAAVKASFESF
ncbi:hypothetical protein QR680_008089 [Steinernema hermaphroditum]|uniref:Uncharacterized protein n=1 Tax=Steinernema hermaphroditum TaxID=289476 RepID=A0AA39IFB3_9BILA|nr:hypothetical protein QR680_008089 [Steinernema hermaphroditum]